MFWALLMWINVSVNPLEQCENPLPWALSVAILQTADRHRCHDNTQPLLKTICIHNEGQDPEMQSVVSVSCCHGNVAVTWQQQMRLASGGRERVTQRLWVLKHLRLGGGNVVSYAVFTQAAES